MLRSPCEEWQGVRKDNGYGLIWTGGKHYRAHRLIYQQHHGHTDLNILHDCDNRACINMDHLRAGTHQDNADDRVKRGRGKTNGNEEKTHCPQGHAYDEANTLINNNKKHCKACQRVRAREWKERAV